MPRRELLAPLSIVNLSMVPLASSVAAHCGNHWWAPLCQTPADLGSGCGVCCRRRVCCNGQDRLVEYESYLLRALAFDVEVELPHHHLLSYARSLHCPAHVTQAAWGLVNDCFETTLVSDAKPHVVACAAIGLAASLAKVQLQLQRQAQPAQIVTPGAGADHGQQWFQVLGGATSSEIECVTERLTQLYAALEAHSQ